MSISTPEGRTSWAREVVPAWVFALVAAAGSAVLVGLSWRVFLFWDDFVFLGQGQDAELTRDYLTEPLFSHFSPVARFLNWLAAGHVAAHPWVVPVMVWSLLVSVVCASVWLMVVLHGRTRLALVGSVLLAPSLTLIQLGNWWTAAGNILPAFTASVVAFGAAVQIVRGRSAWWYPVCFVALVVGVLDYELPMLLPGYIGLWVLLFKDRVTDETLWRLLRRTWALWAGLVAIMVVALWNYRFNYYVEVERAGLAESAQALGRSLFRTLVPTMVGFHDPRTPWFSTLSLVVGVLTVVGVCGWLLVTRRGAWRGLLFAASGWLLPTLALALNRVSLFGVTVVDNVIYFYLPALLVVVGVLEAVRAPRRRPLGVGAPGRTAVLAVRASAAVLAVVVVAAYARSAGPTQDYQIPADTPRDYVDQVRSSVEDLRAAGEPFTVINDEVPGGLVPDMFAPYNRVDNVLGLTVPGPLRFDVPGEPYYAVTDDGELERVVVTPAAQVRPSADTVPDQVRLLDGSGRTFGDEGLCFRTTDTTKLMWTLPASVTGEDLVIEVIATAARPTPVVALVAQGAGAPFDRANHDEHGWGPRKPGQLDTVEPLALDRVKLAGFVPGVRVCVSSLAVGSVEPG